jgi:phosphatidate cytidylyltransferase
MLKQRVISAIVLIPIVAVLAWLGGWWMTGFVAIYAGVTAWELFRMLARLAFARPVMGLGVPMTALLVLEGGMAQDPIRLQALLTIFILIGLVTALFLNRPNAPTDMLITLGGAFFLGMSLRFLALLRNRPEGLWWLILTAVTVWVVDSGAYFTGRAIGKHKFWPRISPKKTWEGFFGGLIAGAIVAALMAQFMVPGVRWQQGVMLGAVIGAVGPLGDLSESLFKRQSGVKDSSNLIPGHGGFFDRIDSFIFAAPVVFLILQFAGW